jgi:hypothetical protein
MKSECFGPMNSLTEPLPMESPKEDAEDVTIGRNDCSDDPDIDNHIVELSSHSIKFEPVNDQNAVFYDESNRQVDLLPLLHGSH